MTKKLKDIYSQSLIYVEKINVSKRDIEYLIKETFSLTNVDFILKQDKSFDDALFVDRLEELKKGKPVEYILGYASFCLLKFKVDENTLIPRSETEDLVYRTIEFVKKMGLRKPRILDIGSGSGCISITLNKMLIDSIVESVDISSKALEVAKENNVLNNTNVEFYQSDCFEKVNGTFDVIISNPPYIDRNSYVQESVLKYEPHTALFADDNGLAIYKRIIEKLLSYVNRPSIVAFEISPDLVDRLEMLIKEHLGECEYSFEKDLNGFDRFLFISLK